MKREEIESVVLQDLKRANDFFEETVEPKLLERRDVYLASRSFYEKKFKEVRFSQFRFLQLCAVGEGADSRFSFRHVARGACGGLRTGGRAGGAADGAADSVGGFPAVRRLSCLRAVDRGRFGL